MPVLEAMASGLPVIVTAGGPTDEFCPPEAGWQIRSIRKEMPLDQLRGYEPETTPWMLEPDRAHLMELLQIAAASSELVSKGKAGRAAAECYSWDAIAERYDEQVRALADTPSRRADSVDEGFPLAADVRLRMLATPAWRGEDQLDQLLGGWALATTSDTDACLYLLADPASAGDPAQIEAHVLAAAERADVDLEACADVEILLEPFRSDRDQRLHAATDIYVPLHAACAGHSRMARSIGNVVADIRTIADVIQTRLGSLRAD